MKFRITAWASILAMTTWAQTPTTATQIKHLVVIFQENVSFDHYFATYPNALNGGGEPLFLAGRRTPGVNGLSGPLLTRNPNSVQPFRLSRAQAIVCDQSHSYTNEQKARDHGLMDQFVDLDGATQTNCNDLGKGKGLVMGYYDGNTVTALWNYAQHFALSDNFFSTTFGPSTLGHLNLISGQTNGATIVHDAGTASAAVMSGTVIGDILPAFDDCVAPNSNTISMSGLICGRPAQSKGHHVGLVSGWLCRQFAPFRWHRSLRVTAPAIRRHCVHQRLHSQSRSVSVLPVDGQPAPPGGQFGRDDRPVRPGKPSVRHQRLLPRAQRRESAGGQPAESTGVPRRPRHVLEPAGRAELPGDDDQRAPGLAVLGGHRGHPYL